MAKHQEYMQQALQQARLAWGISKPNPAVGCVLVRDDMVVGQGHTQELGHAHAEVMALKQAGANAQGATAYVTLEPCSHYGRTPPCTKALIKAGVDMVVYGCEDPNPLVAGRGLQQLKEAGVTVVGPVLPAACAAINPGFMHAMAHGKPYVFSKLAASLDGRTAMASGESQWITGAAARAQVHLMRAQSCAVITGIGSILADNPSMTCRQPELQIAGIGDNQWARIKQPLRVVLDSQLRAPINAKIFAQPGSVLVLTCIDDISLHQPYLNLGVEVAVVPGVEGKVDLAKAVQLLQERGCQQLMLEAGAGLNASFLEAGLVDNLQVFMAPKLLGASGKPLLAQNIDHLEDAWQLAFSQVQQVGEDLLLSLDLS
jgi:diaminohydroxyphosphoribosylaminopyrimidine deaminase/5-amino-6-(5-phosphoribosylamino)uracil reductase